MLTHSNTSALFKHHMIVFKDSADLDKVKVGFFFRLYVYGQKADENRTLLP